MFLLSRIITKEWFKSLFGAIVVLFILTTVADVVNGFLRSYDTQRVFVEYITKLPSIMGKMLPIAALLASLFTINKLKSHSELIAILATGYSIPRVILLIIFCSTFVATLQFLNLGFLEASSNKYKRQEIEKSQKHESKYIARSRIGKSKFMWYKTTDYFASFRAFDRRNQTLKNISIYFFNEKNLTSKIIKADIAEFVGGFKWLLKKVRVYENLNELNFPNSVFQKELTIKLKEVPKDFDQFESDITTLNFFELFRFVRSLRNTGINTKEYEVMLWDKVTSSLICIIFALFPLSGLYAPNRRGSSFGKNVGITLVFAVSYWVIHSTLLSMGNNGSLLPVLATLGTPLGYLLLIFLNFKRSQKL